MAVTSNLLHQNKSFMQKKDSQMSLDVAQSAVQRKKLKTETAVAVLVVNNAKCSLQFVLLVEKKQQFLSNHQVTNQYIAAIAINHVNVATGKLDHYLALKTLLRLHSPRRVFLLFVLFCFAFGFSFRYIIVQKTPC